MTEMINQLVKAIIIILVIALVIGGVIILFRSNILPWIKGLGVG